MMRRFLPECSRKPRHRRAHQKSRKGCSECKARHIKCDEGRPRCTNCITVDRLCSFPASHHDLVASNTQADPEKSEITVAFDAIHLICLHHAETHMGEYLAFHSTPRPIIDMAIDHAVTSPFLASQLLALSALHLSTQNDSKSLLYYHKAMELQTNALGLYKQSKRSSADCIPVFLFATLLGIHVLRETLSNHRSTLSTFVEAFVNYTRLHRGVYAAIELGSWESIRQSNLEPLLAVAKFSEEIETQIPGTETLSLRNFLEEYDARSDSIDACKDALKQVQWMLDLSKQDSSTDDLGIHATMAWPLVISQKYITALHQHRPEALVVLAFYVAALRRYRNFWVFGDSGRILLHMISENIGTFWQGKLSSFIESI